MAATEFAKLQLLLLAELDLEKDLRELPEPPKKKKTRRICFSDEGTRSLIKNILEKKFESNIDRNAIYNEYNWDCSILVNHDIDHESFISVSRTLPGRFERELLSAKFRLLQRSAAMTHIMAFPDAHDDLVTVVDFNYFGTRILTASADHRIVVQHRTSEGSIPTKQDTWTAHDAEITDAKWSLPWTGTHIASVGEDMKLKVWAEDLTQAENSGRRFKRVFSMTASNRSPFVSLDFKNLKHTQTYLVAVQRDGMVTVMEPTQPDSFTDWQTIDQWRIISPSPPRGEETSFKVRFDPNIVTVPYMNNMTNDDTILSLVVTSMDSVKIYRNQGTADRRFYQAVQLPTHPSLVRDVSWANGSVRGFDYIATGCKDGKIRIFALYTSKSGNHDDSESADGVGTPQEQATRTPQSGITTAIAGRTNTTSTRELPRANVSGLRHTVSEVACLQSGHWEVWQTKFSFEGDCLLSTGDDGAVRLWKQATNGKWLEFADIDMDDGEDDKEAEDGHHDVGE